MSGLVDALDRFNRKERNLLIRDALGQPSSEWIPLSNDFRERVGKALDGLDIPVDAWWATDYHLNWIAGALVLGQSGMQAINTPHANHFDGDLVRGLIERSQEDVDLNCVGANLDPD